MMISSTNKGLKAEHLTSLLSTIWCLFNHLASPNNDNEQDKNANQTKIFQALFNSFERFHNQSTIKRICLEFIAKILMVIDITILID